MKNNYKFHNLLVMNLFVLIKYKINLLILYNIILKYIHLNLQIIKFIIIHKDYICYLN